MMKMLPIGNKPTKANSVHGKTFSYLPIGLLQMNTQQLIFTRQQANAIHEFSIVKDEGS